MTNRALRLLILSFTITFLVSCSKKSEPTSESHQKTIQGTVEKGPFVRGSVVTVYELSPELNPTGRTFKSEIVDDNGSFSLTDIELNSNYVQLSVNGYYFNELNGNLSTSQITLNAIADITDNKRVNVNVMSHLEEKRVRSLVKTGQKTFSEAKRQALTEVYTGFFVDVAPTTSSELVSLTNNDVNANVLLGISAALLNASQSDNAKLTELLSSISTDLDNDGTFEEALKQKIKDGLAGLHPKTISDNMKNRYNALNITLSDFAVGDFFTVEMKGESNTPPPNTFFTKEEDYINSLNYLFKGIIKSTELYYQLEGRYCNTLSVVDDFYLHQVQANDIQINQLFSDIYLSIDRGVAIMDYAEKSIAFKKYKYKSYPSFALNYWMLTNFWGGVPYITAENHEYYDISRARNSVDQILSSLTTGLNETIENSASFGLDANIARAIAARIALDNGNYAIAKGYLDHIIDSKKYHLADKSQIHNRNEESIFSIEYDQSKDIEPGQGNYSNIIRYTEIVLLASEVNLKLNNKEEAIALLNQVRIRNGKTPIPTTENNVLPFLQEEVKNDLSNEGIYFAFLKRNGLAESVLGIQPFQKLLPLPNIKMAQYPVWAQNPGY